MDGRHKDFKGNCLDFEDGGPNTSTLTHSWHYYHYVRGNVYPPQVSLAPC